MLKEIDPALHVEEAQEHLKKLVFFVMFFTLGVVVVSYNDPNENLWREATRFVLFLSCYGLSIFLSSALWPISALWLSRLDISKGLLAITFPERFPRTVSAFADSWWKNRRVLSVFYVVFRVVTSMALYLPLNRVLSGLWD